MRHHGSGPPTDRFVRMRRARTALQAVLTTALIAAASTVAWFWQVSAGRAVAANEPLHYTVNHRDAFPAAAAIGFNLADVSSVAALDDLPEGAKGVLWMGNGYNQTCSWQKTDEETAATARAARDHPGFSGIYFISDIPHPSLCPDGPDRIAERTALIHRNDPAGRTFIAVSGGHYYQEEFAQLANSADLIGVVVYPCNVKEPDCLVEKITERVQRAFDAGIPVERLVPVFQAFGQDCTTGETKWYRLPTEDELEAVFAIWDELLPPQTRPFDMTYSWGEQTRHACPSLLTANGDGYPDLQTLYSRYFASMK